MEYLLIIFMLILIIFTNVRITEVFKKCITYFFNFKYKYALKKENSIFNENIQDEPHEIRNRKSSNKIEVEYNKSEKNIDKINFDYYKFNPPPSHNFYKNNSDVNLTINKTVLSENNKTGEQNKEETNKINIFKSRIKICAICCKEYHMNFRCHIIDNISPHKLLKIIYEKNLCKICFRGGHSPKMCSFINILKCKICSNLHNTKLHLDTNYGNVIEEDNVKAIEEPIIKYDDMNLCSLINDSDEKKFKTDLETSNLNNKTNIKITLNSSNESNGIIVYNNKTNSITKFDSSDENYESDDSINNSDDIFKSKFDSDCSEIGSEHEFDFDDTD